ncbi:MAG: N-acetylmuramoyl-L-alanine amidase [Ruminococcaceae bacterium]|nr:N-acetylmuramoyl-L-alanine amidase [Oscillospiraceae bacterium]
MLNIIKAYAVKNLCYITAQKMVPKGIVVHSTGANNPNLKRYVDAPEEVGKNQYGNHWNKAKPGGRKVCVHAFIGYDKNKVIRVAEILPLNICCWGVGSGKKGSYNFNPAYIQFEICEDGLKDKTYYTKAFNVAAEYCAHLCKQYNISVENIVGHCEAYRLGYGCNHSDPEHWMKKYNQTMNDFRKQVSEILKIDGVEKENKDETAFENISIQKGDLVSIVKGATYYNGKSIPDWVQKQRWYVKSEPTGSRVVIDKSENGKHSICSPVDKKYLIKIQNNQEKPSKTAEAVSYKCPYLVKVKVACLNIYNDASPNNIKKGAIKDKGVYTIVEEKIDCSGKKWGKLKSGAGWILLDSVEKI